MERKTNQKKFLVFKITAFERGPRNCHILEQDTSHRQSLCYQETLRFNISLMQAYFKASCLILMKNIIKAL